MGTRSKGDDRKKEIALVRELVSESFLCVCVCDVSGLR